MDVALPTRPDWVAAAALLIAGPLAVAVPIAALFVALAPGHGVLSGAALAWVVGAVTWLGFAAVVTFGLRGPRGHRAARVAAASAVVPWPLLMMLLASCGPGSIPDFSYRAQHASHGDPALPRAILSLAILFVPAVSALLLPLIHRAAGLRYHGSLPALTSLLRRIAALLGLAALLAWPVLAPAAALALLLAIAIGAGARELERRRRAVLAAAASGALQRMPSELAWSAPGTPLVGHTATHALVIPGASTYRDRPVALYLVD